MDVSLSQASVATVDLPLYTYKALDRSNATNESGEIRLIDILPGPVAAPLACNIVTVDLAKNPQYEALSYVWGTGGLSHEVRVRGKATSKLPITSTLDSALRKLRYEDRIRRMWIDQICINLTDGPERGHQVRYMRHIYWNANRVVIDLGEGTEDSDRAFDYAATLHDAGRLERDFVLDDLELTTLQEMPTDVVHSISDILLRPWFQRVWVIQEVILASEVLVYCGSRTVSWSQLFALTGNAFDHPILRKVGSEMSFRELETLSSAWAMVQHTTSMRRKHGVIRERCLAMAVLSHCNAQATDPRDKIFSLLGTATDDVASRIEVDYPKPVGLVYRDFARAALEQGSVYLLSHAGVAQASVLKLPSWVPDWCGESDKRFYWPLGYRASGPAGKKSRAIVTSADVDMIHVRAGLADEIQITGEAFIENEDYDSMVIHACECVKIIEGLHRYPTGEEVLEAYCRTLIADRWRSLDQIEAPERYSELYMSLFSDVERAHLNEVQSTYLWNIYSRSKRRRFCVTRNGYMGLMPRETREGDVIYIVFGAKTPFVLRKTEDAYCLIGECYIHGLMYGEALKLEHFKEEMLPLR